MLGNKLTSFLLAGHLSMSPKRLLKEVEVEEKCKNDRPRGEVKSTS
jgi:hypothetical protein